MKKNKLTWRTIVSCFLICLMVITNMPVFGEQSGGANPASGSGVQTSSLPEMPDSPVKVDLTVLTAFDTTRQAELVLDLDLSVNTSGITGLNVIIPLESPDGSQYFKYDLVLEGLQLPEPATGITYTGSTMTIHFQDDLPIGIYDRISFAFPFEASYGAVADGTILWDSAGVVVETFSPAFSGTLSSVKISAGTAAIPPSVTENISLKWLPDDSGAITLTPEKNERQYVTMKLDFSLGSGSNVREGDIEIRTPYKIFENRSGVLTGGIEALSILKQDEVASNPNHSIGYCYYIDETNNEIVITNFRELLGSATTFTCSITYYYYPHLVADGYTNDSIRASVKVGNNGDGTYEKEDVSNTLSVTLETGANINIFQNLVKDKYEIWPASWGTAPADASDYFYVVWHTSFSPKYTCTQPYDVYLTSNPGLHGTVISFVEVPNNASADFNAFNPVPAAGPHYKIEYKEPSPLTNSREFYVAVKYPRTALAETASFPNKMTAVLEGLDSAAETKTATGTFTYTSVSFDYKGDLFKTLKRQNDYSSSATYDYYGAINRIDDGVPGNIGNATASGAFNIEADVRGWSMTNGGQNAYTVDLIDEQMFIDATRLEPEDRDFTYFNVKFTEYDFSVDANLGLKDVEATDYENYKQVEVYCKTDLNADWTLAGSVKRTGVSSYVYTDVNGAAQNLSAVSRAAFPAGTHSVKFTHAGSRYRVNIVAYLSMAINPTERVKNCLAGKDVAYLNNISTLKVTDKDGVIKSPEDVTEVNFLSNTTYAGNITAANLKAQVKNYDSMAYSKVLGHASSVIALKRLTPRTTLSMALEYGKSITYSSAEEKASIPYVVKAIESGTVPLTLMSMEEAKQMDDFVKEQREGVFYILLPPGAAVKPSDINAYTFNYHSYKVGTGTKINDFTCEFVKNWQGSGRTMMIIHVVAPTAQNFSVNGSTLYSGFEITYKCDYPYQSISAYGKTVKSRYAYRSGTGVLSSGITAAESNLDAADKPYFTDLNNDGADDGGKNTIYNYNNQAVTVNVAAETGFSAKTKETDDLNYGRTANVFIGGAYSYRLYLENDSAGTAKDLVFYDILEAYDSGGVQWRGALEGVDVSYAGNMGVNPVVYYSTISIPDTDSEAGNDLLYYRDLTDTAVWSPIPPQDLRQVTAIAVDLRKKADGSDFVLAKNSVMLCDIMMRAPEDYNENTGSYAWNRAYYTVTMTPDLSTPSTFTQECGYTKVLLHQPLEIGKTSSPTSGTSAEPATIVRDAALEYTVTVKNTNSNEAIANIQVTDALPNGYTADFQNISYYFGSNAAGAVPVEQSTRVSAAQLGRTLTFEIDKLSGGETVNIVIPGTATGIGGLSLINEAAVTKINGYAVNIVSEATWHKIPKAQAVVVNLTGEKFLTGKELEDNIFSFIVEDSDGMTVARGVNKADGTIEFSEFYIDTPGIYRYKVTEENDGLEGFTYDDSELSVTVTVAEIAGHLEASVTGGLTFNNIYTGSVMPPPSEPTDIIIEKSSNPANGETVSDGGIITYYIEVSNSGGAAVSVTVKDTIPSGTKYVNGSAGCDDASKNVTAGCDAALNEVSFTIPSLEAGKAVTVRFEAIVTDATQSQLLTLTNQAFAYYNDGAGEVTKGSNTVEHVVEQGENPPPVMKYPYRVEYYANDDTPGNLLGEVNGITEFLEGYRMTEDDATHDLGDGWLMAKKPEGYEADNEFYPVISADAADNVVKVIYKKLPVYPYRVDYFKDDLSSDNALGSAGGSEAFNVNYPLTAADVHGDLGDGWLDMYIPVGYQHGKIQGFFPIISAGDNVVIVLYEKEPDGDTVEEKYSYTVEYYKDDLSQGNMLGSPVDAGAYYTVGYQIRETDLARDLGSNWINARRPQNYGVGAVEGELPVITIELSNNVVKILYKKLPVYNYDVEYYIDGNLIDTVNGSERPDGHKINVVDLADDLGADWFNRHRPDGYGGGVTEYPIISGSSDNVVKVFYNSAMSNFVGLDANPGNVKTNPETLKENPKTGIFNTSATLRLMISCCILAVLAIIWREQIKRKIKELLSC